MQMSCLRIWALPLHKFVLGVQSILLLGPLRTEKHITDFDHFLSSFVKFRSAISEKSKLSQPIRGRGGHLVFPIGPKNTNLVEDIDILLHVKLRWIPFSSFREVKNVSVNLRPGGHLVFLISPKNTNLVEDIMILLPVKFHWILFRAFRGEVKMPQPIRGQSHHLVFRSARKPQIW